MPPRDAEFTDLLRGIHQRLENCRLLPINQQEGTEFLGLLIANNKKLDDLKNIVSGAQGGFGNISDQVAQLAAAVTSMQNQLGVNTQLLMSIQSLLVGLQTGVSPDDSAGLAAGLAQLQATNAVLQADKPQP